MRGICILVCSTILSSFSVAADMSSERARIAGTWHGDGDSNEIWIVQHDGDNFHITHSKDHKTIADFQCSYRGQDCKVEMSGHSVVVSMWFDGPELVELERKGNDVMKHYFKTAENGEVLEVQMIPVVPDGKAELSRFKRAQESVASSK